MARASESELVAVGVSRRKAEYVIGVARADVDYDAMRNLEDDEIRALDSGASVYMHAPLDVGMLRARIRALLRRADAACPPIPSA